jgi:predicted alpha/beta-hydrolase family hydrolase
VIVVAREIAPRLVAAGRSMGGRIASQVVAQGVEVAALALFAYPLHPPGRPDATRDQHLATIAVPTLFVSGTRDAFGSADELGAVAAKMARARVNLLEGADHGFSVAKSTGSTRTDVWDEAYRYLVAFLSGLDA